MPPKHSKVSPLSFTYGIAGLALLNLLMFGDILFNGNGRVLSSSQADLYLHFTAWRQFAFDQLRQGHLALWNPHYLCGAPFLGNFQSALLYPPNWLYLFLPLATAINVGIVFHVFLAGFFAYLWVWRRGLHPAACFVSGTTFMFGGAYFLHLFAGHLPNLCTMVWAPLIFLAIDGLFDKFSVRWILLGIFAVSMQILAGHPQYVYFTGIIATIYALLNLQDHKAKLKALGGFISIYAGASLLTAAQLWTGFQAFQECGRNIPLEYRSAGSFSFPPENLLTLILPEFFGNLSSTLYWGRWFLWEVSLFIGVTAFFLILLSLVASPLKKWRWVFATAVIALVFSLGVYTPFFRFLYDWVPYFKGFRGICKFDFLVCLFLALLSGMGLDYLMKNGKLPRGYFFSVLMLGFVFLGMELFIVDSVRNGLEGGWARWFASIHWLEKSVATMDVPHRAQYVQDAGFQTALSLLTGGGICLFLSLLLVFKKWNQKWVYAIVTLLVIELFVFARVNRPTFEMSQLQKKFDQIQNIRSQIPGDYRVYGTASASLVSETYDIWEDEPMVLGRYGRFVCYSQGLSENQLFSVLPIFQKFNQVFGMIRLKYRVFAEQDPPQVYPLPFKVLPRMLLLNEWEVQPDTAKTLAALFDPSFEPARKVILEKTPDPAPASGKVGGTVQWKDLTTDEIEIKADLPRAALLLVTDNYSEGWGAVALPESAQARYEVIPGNYFLRVIPLAAGKHHFILRYRPTAFVIGKWVSILSAMVFIAILIFSFRTKPHFSRRIIS
jgi:hypothetical protein